MDATAQHAAATVKKDLGVNPDRSAQRGNEVFKAILDQKVYRDLKGTEAQLAIQVQQA